MFMISFGRVDLVNGCMANRHPHPKGKRAKICQIIGLTWVFLESANSFALKG